MMLPYINIIYFFKTRAYHNLNTNLTFGIANSTFFFRNRIQPNICCTVLLLLLLLLLLLFSLLLFKKNGIVILVIYPVQRKFLSIFIVFSNIYHIIKPMSWITLNFVSYVLEGRI
jgi:hypothetical protein